MTGTSAIPEAATRKALGSKLPALHAIGKVLIGNGGYVALGFLANIVSANGLSPAGFGLVSVCLALLNVLQEICGNGLDLAMVRLAAPHVESNPGKAALFYRAALQLKLFVNSLVALFLWLLAPLIAGFMSDPEQMQVLLRWVSAGLLGATLYNYSLAKLQAEEQFSLYAFLRIFNNVAKLTILAAIWYLNIFRPVTVLASWMAAFFVGYALALFLQKRKHIPAPAYSESLAPFRSEVFHYSKWVVGSSFLFTLYSRTDMLILSRYSSPAEIGQYAAAWNITFIIDLMTYSVIIALLPRAASLTSRPDFSAYLKRTFVICIGIAALLSPTFFLADQFFATFFPAYSMSADVFRILFAGAIITLLFHPLYLILYARNRVSRLTLINFLMVIFCVLLGLQFIPLYGATGAAWVTVAGRVFASTLIVYYVLRELRGMH